MCIAPRCPGQGMTDKDVDAAIEAGKKAILSAYVGGAGRPGHFAPEQTGNQEGGVTAMCTYALLVAGVNPQDEKISGAIRYLEARRMPGVYSRGFRANVWAHLVRHTVDPDLKSKYRKLLQKDAQWLTAAMKTGRWNGWYHYTGPQNSGDHSCTQFGVLGVWACANARIELPHTYWKIVDGHWLGTQWRDGGWSYRGQIMTGDGFRRPRGPRRRGQRNQNPLSGTTVNMTCAGVNSLYVVLDKLHARTGSNYKRFKGITFSEWNKKSIGKTLRGIQQGLKWLEDFPGLGGDSGYYRFGIERLGRASGRKYLQGEDWYRHLSERIVRQGWGRGPVENAFNLLVLSFGRAPVIFNKLEAGPQEEWNTYFRDIANLTDYLSERFEYHHNWQVVDLKRPLNELRDAPILYINGENELKFTPKEKSLLRDFLDGGGTILGHANRAGPVFSRSFRDLFETMYKEDGYTFTRLPKEHPVFRSYFGKDRNRIERRIRQIPLEGLSDGGRVFVFLLPRDIAGAWQQHRRASFPEMYMLAANIRFYAAPGYHELPRRLRSSGTWAGADWGSVPLSAGPMTVAPVRYSGDWRANPRMWEFAAPKIRKRTGLEITRLKPVSLTDPDLSKIDLLHLTGRKAVRLAPDEIKALKAFLEGGGFLLADAACGSRQFDRSFREVLKQLTPGRPKKLLSRHPIFSGSLPGMTEIKGAQLSTWAQRRLIKPELLTLNIGGRVAVIYSPLDLTAVLNGHYVFGSLGYKPKTAWPLMCNILLWRDRNRQPKTESREPKAENREKEIPSTVADPHGKSSINPRFALRDWVKKGLLRPEEAQRIMAVREKQQEKNSLDPKEKKVLFYLNRAIGAKTLTQRDKALILLQIKVRRLLDQSK